MTRRSYQLLFGPSLAAGLAAVAVAALSAAPVVAAADRTPRVQTRAAIGNPVAGNEGFTAFVHHDADVASNENEGTMALGGNLVLSGTGGNYNVAVHEPSHPYTVPGDARPTGLLIGGRVDWTAGSSQGIVQVQSGTYVKLGDPIGTDVLNTGEPTELVPNGHLIRSTPRVELTTVQPTASVIRSGLIDFDAVFDAYRRRSADMANCPDTVVPTEANNTTPLPQPWPQGAQAYLALDPEHTNIWTVSKQQLAALGNITLRSLPTANGPLVINVTDDSGVFDWNVTSLAGFGGAAAPYVLWNFPETTRLTLTGSDSIDGTVYAPRARLIDLNPGNIQGNVIVDSLVHGDAEVNGGEIHDFPFEGNVDCEPATPTETPTETLTPTEEPTETLTPTEIPTEVPTCPAIPTPTQTMTGPIVYPTHPGRPHPTHRPCRPLPPTGASIGPGALYPAMGLVVGGAVILGAVQYKRRARKH